MSTDFNSLIKYNEPILSRKQITQIILAQKIKLKISWQKIAEALDCSREWIIAASLGQMKLTKIDAEKLSNLLNLTDEICSWLQIVPNKSCNNVPPADPLLYRFYEILGVYGPAIKEIIHEDLGDGIMSAIDFTVNVDTKSVKDRIEIKFSGKFLPYNKF